MTPRKISIHQYHEGSRVGDAITNAMLLVQDLLRQEGFTSEVFAASVDPALSSRIKQYSELRPDPDDMLLIHHGWYQSFFDKLVALPCRKVLIYHNITPPKFFDRRSVNYQYSLQSFAQLLKLGEVTEASICDSTFNAHQLRLRGFKNISVIPLLKDFGGIRNVPHRKAPYYDQSAVFRLLYVGRLISNKCQLELVKIAGKIRSIGCAPVELVLVGYADAEPEYTDKILLEIQKLDLVDHVVMTGPIPDDTLFGYYRAANAYVSLSEHEGFGIPLIEAMSLDLPVIAYAAPGVAATMGNAGILIRDKEPATIRAHLQRLHHDRAFRSDLIRVQRARVLWYSRDRIVSAMRQWLIDMGAYETSAAVAGGSVGGQTEATSSNQATHLAIDFEAESSIASLPPTPIHYVIEGPFETSYSLAICNRQMALALDQLSRRAAYIEPAEGVEEYKVNVEAAERLPTLVKNLVRPAPLTIERIVTIRFMHPPRPNGMLGDVRLMHFPWEESAIPSHLADLVNTHVDGILVSSEFVKRALRNSGVRPPIAIVSLGVDHAFPSETQAGQRFQRVAIGPAAPFTFLHVSSGLPRKGIEELVTAYCIAFKSTDPVLLVIKTFDNDQNVVRSWIDRVGNVGFAPAIQVINDELDQQQMESLYAKADAVVLPSRGEAFNLPAAEGMAHGIPIIVTGYGGHLDFCNNENAMLVDYTFEWSSSHLKVPDSMWIRASLVDLVKSLKTSYVEGRALGTATALRARRAQCTALKMRWNDVAERIDRFVAELYERPVVTRKIRLAWVSTYNAQCGIATHSEKLLKYFDRSVFDVSVIANHQPLVREDSDNIFRLWTDSTGRLDVVRNHLLANNYDAVMFQFNFGFFNLHEFDKTLAVLHDAKIDTYVTLHKTEDAEDHGQTISLNEIAPILEKCTRIFVHGIDDVNRLKAMGITDNVVIIRAGVQNPPPLEKIAVRNLLGLQRFHPVIGTFGFLLPPKGSQELIYAFALVLIRYPNAFFLMVCSQYPVPESAQELDSCLALIKGLGLENNVRLVSDFLDDEEEAIFLLSACDMIVYGYQNSGESASGAVRIGLATGRPVGTTPLRIFSEVSEFAHQFAGTSAADIAQGIQTMLADGYPKEEFINKQRQWLQSNSWATQARRIGNLILANFEDKRGVDVRAAASVEPAVSRAETAGDSLMREMLETEFMSLASGDFISLSFRRIVGREPTSEEIQHYSTIDVVENPANRWRIIAEISKLANPGTVA